MRADVKITLTIWTVAIVLCAISVQASAQIYFPLPINGRVDGINVANLPITVTNLRTGKMQTTATNGAGEYLVDAANFDDESGTIMKYTHGDLIKIEIDTCKDKYAECTQILKYEGQMELFTVFDLTEIILPCPPCPSCDCPSRSCGSCGSSGECICPDEGDLECPSDVTPYAECDSCCPSEPTCEVCEVCADCDECPEDLSTYLIGLAIVGGAIVVAYLGRIKISRIGDDDLSKALAAQMKDRTGIRFWEQDGRVLIKHLHRGIVGYHSPDIVHRDPADRHERGKLIV